MGGDLLLPLSLFYSMMLFNLPTLPTFRSAEAACEFHTRSAWQGRHKMSYSFTLPGLELPHEGHEEHLCFLHHMGYLKKNLETYKKLVANPKFVCRNCGRTAASEKSLCDPEKL
jgi:hypothetical protein